MDKELTTFIIKELGKHRNRKEIIQKVCERGGLNWKEAERLFVLVEARNRSTVTARQSPLLLFLSVGTLLLGIGLLAYNMDIVLAFFQKEVLGQILSLQSGHYQLTGLVTGLAMTAGGMVGLWKALGSIFPNS